MICLCIEINYEFTHLKTNSFLCNKSLYRPDWYLCHNSQSWNDLIFTIVDWSVFKLSFPSINIRFWRSSHLIYHRSFQYSCGIKLTLTHRLLKQQMRHVKIKKTCVLEKIIENPMKHFSLTFLSVFLSTFSYKFCLEHKNNFWELNFSQHKKKLD